MEKWKSDRGGVTWIAAILLALVGIMLIIIARPAWNRFRFKSEQFACAQAMKSAYDGLIIDYLSHFKTETETEALEVLEEVMPERESLCPAGGTIYLVKDKDGIFEPVCGLHCTDKKHRTRLNASRARELLRRRLWVRELRAQEEEKEDTKGAENEKTEPISIFLNGKGQECIRVSEEADLRRGTSTSHEYEGIVVLYGLSGDGDFASSGVPEGELCYFLYADEDYCAVWHAGDKWTGSAYD